MLRVAVDSGGRSVTGFSRSNYSASVNYSTHTSGNVALSVLPDTHTLGQLESIEINAGCGYKGLDDVTSRRKAFIKEVISSQQKDICVVASCRTKQLGFNTFYHHVQSTLCCISGDRCDSNDAVVRGGCSVNSG